MTIKPVRVNARISAEMNDWLEERSQRTGLSKSNLMYLALENYIKEDKAMKLMDTVPVVLSKFQQELSGIKKMLEEKR